MTYQFGDARLPQRFWIKATVVESGCWEWVGALSAGYGSYSNDSKKSDLAHRVIFKALVGEIPGTFPHGLTVDHLCKNKRCVNPSHMELVSRKVNSQRANILTHCKRGHSFAEHGFTEGKGRTFQTCRLCQRIRRQAWAKNNPEKISAMNKKQGRKRYHREDTHNAN